MPGWSTDDKNCVLDALKAAFGAAGNAPRLLKKIDGTLWQAYQRHGPIPGDVHECLTKWLSKPRATDRERAAFWKQTIRYFDIPGMKASMSRPLSELSQFGLEVRHDPDISRLVIKLHEAMSYRIWLAMQDYRRRQKSGAQWICYADLANVLASYGLPCGRTAMDNALDNPLFFRRNDDRVYFKGIAQVAAGLTQRAHDERLPDQAKADKPGGVLYFTSLDMPLAQFESRCYAQWLDSRVYPMLARKTLEMAWNRTRQTLRKWERQENIQHHKNYRQTAELRDERIPTEIAKYIEVTDKDGELHGRFSWQGPNYYAVPKAIRGQRHTRGQGRKVRKAVNAVLHKLDSPLLKGEGALRQVCNWKHTSKGTKLSWNKYDKALDDNPDRRHMLDFVQLAYWRWELMPSYLDILRTYPVTNGQYRRAN